jgi:TRAP-type C4-dicarboxylate transport system permease small subunit
VIAGAFILFVVFEAGFYVITSLLAQSQTLGLPSWYMVVAGNLIASLVMGMYLWRAYPRLRSDIDAALSGRA